MELKRVSYLVEIWPVKNGSLLSGQKTPGKSDLGHAWCKSIDTGECEGAKQAHSFNGRRTPRRKQKAHSTIAYFVHVLHTPLVLLNMTEHSIVVF